MKNQFLLILTFFLSVCHSYSQDKFGHSTLRNTTTSVLSEGEIYKISVDREGVFKIDGNFLKEHFNISLGIPSSGIQLFSNHGGSLPEDNIDFRVDDLLELPIKINDGGDGKFDEADFMLFYADGPNMWKYDIDQNEYFHNTNPYSLKNYIYIKLDGNSGKRVAEKTSAGTPDYTSSNFDFLQIYEDERTNLLGTFQSTEGTGKDWYGDYFGSETNLSFGNKFDISEIGGFGEAQITVHMALRSENISSNTLKIGGNNFSKSVSGTNLTNIESTYAQKTVINEKVNISEGTNIDIEFNRGTSKDEAWLDNIQLIYRKKLSGKNNQIRIADSKAIVHETAALNVPSGAFEYWDITNLDNVSILNPTNGKLVYNPNGNLTTFYQVINGQYLTPGPEQKVENQNLHGIERADLIVLYHPLFEDAANRLATHREIHSGLVVELVNVELIFNEFSSGRIDPAAIRDFAKMVHERDPNFQYLLLLGDGSYDYRQLDQNLANHNFMPVYETDESLHPINGFPTDDFYALLDDDEGNNLKGDLDIAVGRLPVTSAEMASNVIDKIIRYDTSSDTYSDWRNKIAFAADDEDDNTHFDQADGIAELIEIKHPEYNQSKIYFDSYVQESTPGGARYDAATDAINNSIQKGVLVFNYLGHGGPKGWAQERVLKISDIDSWNNNNSLPLLITATCSFTGYDDPSLVSAGEHAMQKQNGGVIGLFTTVRAVYSSENERLTKAVYNQLFLKDGLRGRRFGDIILTAKNQNADASNVKNDRKFVLIGDPSQRLALPQLNILTKTINQIPVDSGMNDTINALDIVTLTGHVTDNSNSTVTGFDGEVFVTVFDKESSIETLANDPSESDKAKFGIYRNILFKGSATVEKGEFEVTFVVPKDINYEIGKGRVSYYAYNGDNMDAAGNYNDIIIGGSGENTFEDNEGPTVDLFLNSNTFKTGDIVNKNPILIAHLSDDFGINVSGTSIGHDIILTIDGDNRTSRNLNEFYESNVNDYTSGTIRLPLFDLEKGEHFLTLKAWDVSNNSTEGRIDFIISDEETGELKNVFAYPNPSFDYTNFSFDHNYINENLTISIEIYSSIGKLVRILNFNRYADDTTINGLDWDTSDATGKPVSKGMYFYKIKVEANQLNTVSESKFEKIIKQ